MSAPTPESLEAEDPEAAVSGFDSALSVADVWSAKVSRQLFRLGIYVTLPALVVLVTTDVVLRYVFDAPLQWARDVNGLFLLMSIAAALPHAWDRAYHIRMEVAYERFPPGLKRSVDVISAFTGVVFFGLMAYQAAVYVPFMMRTGETGEDLLWPLWPYMAFMAICAALTVVRLIANPGHAAPAVPATETES